MTLEILSKNRYFDGHQYQLRHHSEAIGLEMRFGVYIPEGANVQSTPVLFYLCGFTGNARTFSLMGSPQQAACRDPVVLVSPDTSPRKTGEHENSGKFNVGASASFYLDATAAPWRAHWRMETYLAQELPALLARDMALATDRLGITGHCMGGLGALNLGLKYPDRFRSVSALAPICKPSHSTWGEEAFSAYFGPRAAQWAQHDPSLLLADRRFAGELLLDIGAQDEHRFDQLHVDDFHAQCLASQQPVRLNVREGHDHSLHFVQTHFAEHIAFHREQLGWPATVRHRRFR